MFIAHLSNGQILKEGEGITWEKVPDGIDWLEVMTFKGEVLTLPKCEEYFFSNEDTIYIKIGEGSPSSPVTTAKIVGGIVGEKAIYIRIETNGNIKIEWKDRKDLPFTPQTYKKSKCQL